MRDRDAVRIFGHGLARPVESWFEINFTALRPTFACSATECGPNVANNSSRNFPLITKACEVNQCYHDDRIEFAKKTLLTCFCFDSQVFGILGCLDRDHRPL